MILGKHTLNETRDLLAVADYRFKETGKAYDALLANPPPGGASATVLVPGTDLPSITADWQALSAKWAADRVDIRNTLVQKGLMAIGVPADVLATETEYKRILDDIQFQENVKGSLQDITKRIETASGKQILYPSQPGQNSTDVDISLFGSLDNATKKMDAAADASAEAAKKAVTSSTGMIIGGTIIGTVLLLGAAKHYL